MLLRMYLPIFLLLYLMVAFVLPSWRVYKETGINPVTFKNSGNAHDYIGVVMKVLIGLLVVSVLFFSFSLYLYQYLVPVSYLDNQMVQTTGLILIHLSLIWLMIAQYQMHQSWRIGIDEENRTELVTRGLFSRSRNPIFVGMIGSVIGLFLILPNALLFAVVVTTYIVIQIQIRLEEQFLTNTHGDVYKQYRSKVRRMI